MQNITIDEVCSENAILYKVKVNNIEVEALYDMGTSINDMSKCFLDKIQNKQKLIKCHRNISGAGGKALVLLGECFIQLQRGQRKFYDRVVVTENLM